MSRRKQPAMAVPTSDAEALALLNRYVGEERRLRGVAAFADAEIATIEQRRDADLAAAGKVQRERFAAIKAWWEAGGKDRFAKGKNRSARLAGARIGVRTGMPQVKLPKGIKVETFISWFTGIRDGGALLRRFVRQKPSIDKDAIIAAFGGKTKEDAIAETLLRDREVDVIQLDEFFIDVGPADPVETVRAEPD
jgi:phage host-nuclease inhibitor protein Gam